MEAGLIDSCSYIDTMWLTGPTAFDWQNLQIVIDVSRECVRFFGKLNSQ